MTKQLEQASISTEGYLEQVRLKLFYSAERNTEPELNWVEGDTVLLAQRGQKIPCYGLRIGQRRAFLRLSTNDAGYVIPDKYVLELDENERVYLYGDLTHVKVQAEYVLVALCGPNAFARHMPRKPGPAIETALTDETSQKVHIMEYAAGTPEAAFANMAKQQMAQSAKAFQSVRPETLEEKIAVGKAKEEEIIRQSKLGPAPVSWKQVSDTLYVFGCKPYLAWIQFDKDAHNDKGLPIDSAWSLWLDHTDAKGHTKRVLTRKHICSGSANVLDVATKELIRARPDLFCIPAASAPDQTEALPRPKTFKFCGVNWPYPLRFSRSWESWQFGTFPEDRISLYTTDVKTAEERAIQILFVLFPLIPDLERHARSQGWPKPVSPRAHQAASITPADLADALAHTGPVERDKLAHWARDGQLQEVLKEIGVKSLPATDASFKLDTTPADKERPFKFDPSWALVPIDLKRTVRLQPVDTSSIKNYDVPGTATRLPGAVLAFSCPGCGSVQAASTDLDSKDGFTVIGGSLDDLTQLSIHQDIHCTQCCGWKGRLINGMFMAEHLFAKKG